MKLITQMKAGLGKILTEASSKTLTMIVFQSSIVFKLTRTVLRECPASLGKVLLLEMVRC